MGDNFVPSVEVSVNYLNNGSESRYPHRTYVTLKRKCSNGAEYRHSVILSIEKAAVAHEVPSVVSSDAHPAPVIDTIIAPTRMCEERPAMFQAVASGENLRYRWDFGDGTFNYGNPVYHSYNVRSMTHITVTLTVTDTFGRTDTGQTYLVVRENKMDDGFLHTMYAETLWFCFEDAFVLSFFLSLPPEKEIPTPKHTPNYETQSFPLPMASCISHCQFLIPDCVPAG